MYDPGGGGGCGHQDESSLGGFQSLLQDHGGTVHVPWIWAPLHTYKVRDKNRRGF